MGHVFRWVTSAKYTPKDCSTDLYLTDSKVIKMSQSEGSWFVLGCYVWVPQNKQSQKISTRITLCSTRCSQWKHKQVQLLDAWWFGGLTDKQFTYPDIFWLFGPLLTLSNACSCVRFRHTNLVTFILQNHLSYVHENIPLWVLIATISLVMQLMYRCIDFTFVT